MELKEEPLKNVDFQAISSATKNVDLPSDDLGRQEEKKYASAMRSEVHRVIVWGLRFGTIVLGALLLIRFWHLSAPTYWRWLSDTEVQSMDKMLFSSAFGGFVFTYLRDSITKSQK